MSKQPLSLRAVRDHPSYIRFLYELLQERPVEANISHNRMPTYEQHTAFVKRDPYSCWFLIMAGDTMAGSIYLTRHQEIGIHIHTPFRRLGLASWAIPYFMDMIGPQKYLANVAPGNAASHALFSKLGGKVIQHTYALC